MTTKILELSPRFRGLGRMGAANSNYTHGCKYSVASKIFKKNPILINYFTSIGSKEKRLEAMK